MKTALRLSALAAALAAVAAAGGLLIPGLYRDNTWVTSAWRGTDLVTLFCAVPLLVSALVLVRRGSARAQLVWLGMLAYLFYGYAYYLFGAAFNRFFLVYAALFALSAWALVFAATNIDASALARRFRWRTPVRLISVYMVLVAVGLAAAWVGASLEFVTTGKLPAAIVASGHPTGIVFALDLSLLVPGFALGAVWLWKRKPWGYVLAAIMTIKGATYTLALLCASMLAARAGVTGAAGEIPLWSVLTVFNLAACALLLGNLQRAPQRISLPDISPFAVLEQAPNGPRRRYALRHGNRDARS